MRRTNPAVLAAGAIVAFVHSWAQGATISGRIKVSGVRDSRDAVVYVAEAAPGSFARPAAEPVMDQKGMVFSPHVLPILAGTTVQFLNSDDVRHNIFSPSAIGDKFNLGTYPKGDMRRKAFNKRGEVVCLCSVHQEMSAYILVLQNPFFAVTGKDGAYRIDGVPAGKYELRIWHEKVKKAVSREIAVPDEGGVTADFELRRQ